MQSFLAEESIIVGRGLLVQALHVATIQLWSSFDVRITEQILSCKC